MDTPCLGHVERGGLHEFVAVLGAEDEAADGHDDGDQGQDDDAGEERERENNETLLVIKQGIKN